MIQHKLIIYGTDAYFCSACTIHIDMAVEMHGMFEVHDTIHIDLTVQMHISEVHDTHHIDLAVQMHVFL